MRTTERRAGRQRGQSTVEFVVLALALVPLLLIVPLLGKYMDIAQTAAMASRYVAFEGSWRHGSSKDDWKTDPELAREVRRRFFSNSDAPIKTDDTAGDFNAHRNTLWFDHRGAPLLHRQAHRTEDRDGFLDARRRACRFPITIQLAQRERLQHQHNGSVRQVDEKGMDCFSRVLPAFGRLRGDEQT